jgi:DNA-binding response OmpR family regulator
MPSVLLVEDDLLLSQAFAEVLQIETGAEVEIIQDGQAVLERLSSAPTDVVLLDLHLPHVSGLEVLRQMRAHSVWANTPVLVMTADVLRSKDAEGLANKVLVKPVNLEDLLAFVTGHLKG